MRNFLMILLVISAAAVFVVFWESPPEIFVREKRTQVEEIPAADSYMRATFTTKYSAGGGISYTLKAESGLYYHREDRFELDKPLLVSSANPDAEPWQIRSDTAHSTEQGGEVVLTDNVYAWQHSAEGKNELLTSRLAYLPGVNRAHSDREVTLKSPGNITTGIGMEADLNTSVYKLLSRVEGTHHVQ